MKERLTKNLGLKLLSLFGAFFVWLAVVNVANPIKTSTEEVAVDIINRQVLENANLTFEIVGKKTATISFKVRTKDEYRVSADDFRAYADLSEMYDVTGAIPIRVEVLNNRELLQSTPVVKSPEVIKIQTEELQTKSFTVKAFPTGEVADGYLNGDIVIMPGEVTVKGPVSQVGQISGIGISFPIEGATADVNGTATPYFYDANGNTLNDLGDSITIVGGDVTYRMQVLKVKEVPLDFVVTGEVADGYRFTGTEASIKSVKVAGLKSDLAAVSTITIQDPALNISGATQDKVCRLDLKDFVDPAMEIAGLENTVVEVTLSVEPLREKSFSAEPGSVVLDGRDDNYSYTPDSAKVEIRVRGLKEDLDSLSTDKMNLHADVSELGEGSHTVPVTIQLDDAFEVLGESTITLEVKERTASAPKQTEESQENE